MNWTKRFDRARKNNGEFTSADKSASCSNRQCALGEVLHNIGYRHPHDFFSLERAIIAVDMDLWRKACGFSAAVRRDHISRAEELYNAIQEYPISQTLKDRLRIRSY